MTSDWPEIEVEATRDGAELVENWLFAAGALSVTYRDEQDQPILEPAPGEVRLWEKLVIKGLFEQGKSTEDIDTALELSAAGLSIKPPPFVHVGLADTAWERTWMDGFKPMQFGNSLWICPNHLDLVDPSAHTIRLDPGLAFGTGTHPTTAQCLHWLGRLPQGSVPLQGRSVIDYGCGSGVLAIGAALLGSEAVWAVDIDPQAIQATRANAEANGVLSQLTVGQPEILSGVRADLIFANILFEPLMGLAEVFADYIPMGGKIVLSGILEEQIRALCLQYNGYFVFDEPQSIDGWALLVATRSS